MISPHVQGEPSLYFIIPHESKNNKLIIINFVMSYTVVLYFQNYFKTPYRRTNRLEE